MKPLALAAAMIFVAASTAVAQQLPSRGDAPSGFELLCGQPKPEDLARIPGTQWLIVSGFSEGAGLKLVDTNARTLRSAYTGADEEIGTHAAFPNCPGPPDPRLLNTQGLHLRSARDNGEHTLYVVNHGGRESVEVFRVDAERPVPQLSWRGCVRLPQGLAANSVATYGDGTILVTVLVHPGDTYADFVAGRNTGGVYEWRPGSTGFQLLPGTRLPGNNGIETAQDDSGFFVVAFGRHAILQYSRDNTKPPIEAIAPGFMPDNIHWDNGRLITAGMKYDEPACGGTRKVVDGKADDMRCHRGTFVAELDPVAMKFNILAEAAPHSRFNGASAAVVVDDEIWIGSYQKECLKIERH